MAKRSKSAMQRLIDGKKDLIEGIPTYESIEGGGAAEPCPEGFRENNKTRGEWDKLHRKLNSHVLPSAYIASWWHGSKFHPTQWVPVYNIQDTVFIKRMTAEAIQLRADAGIELNQRERKILLESDLGL